VYDGQKLACYCLRKRPGFLNEDVALSHKGGALLMGQLPACLPVTGAGNVTVPGLYRQGRRTSWGRERGWGVIDRGCGIWSVPVTNQARAAVGPQKTKKES
jgi:hypothetical protein